MVATPAEAASPNSTSNTSSTSGVSNAQAGSVRQATLDAVLGFHRQMMSRLGGASASEWLRIDLSSGQIKLLFWIASAGEQAMSHVAKALGIGMPAATSLVDKLVDHGLVTREHSPVDRRVVLVRASDAGHALATRLRQLNEGEWRRIMDHVPDESLPLLHQAIGVLSAAIRRAQDSAECSAGVSAEPDSDQPLPL